MHFKLSVTACTDLFLLSLILSLMSDVLKLLKIGSGVVVVVVVVVDVTIVNDLSGFFLSLRKNGFL